MSDRNNERDTGRDKRGRFGTGNAGRPKGARHRVTVAVENLLDGEAEKLTRKAIEMALQGDTVALRLCLERIAPPIRGRSVRVKLPEITSAADTLPVLAAIAKAASSGEIDLESAQALAGLVESHRKAIELITLERRIKQLEDAIT
jgi:hypothetical protein